MGVTTALLLVVIARLVLSPATVGARAFTASLTWGSIAVAGMVQATEDVRRYLDGISVPNLCEFLAYVATFAATDALVTFALVCTHLGKLYANTRRAVSGGGVAAFVATFVVAGLDADWVPNLAMSDDSGLRLLVLEFVAIQALRCGWVFWVAAQLRANPRSTDRVRMSMTWLCVCMAFAGLFLVAIALLPMTAIEDDVFGALLGYGAGATGFALAVAGAFGPASEAISRWSRRLVDA